MLRQEKGNVEQRHGGKEPSSLRREDLFVWLCIDSETDKSM